MFSSAVIVFREIFEIVLIVGVVLAATRGMPKQGLAITLGVAGGLFGAALIAVFTDNISNMAEGMGQELFNALILFTAAGFIGWTIIWMKRHASEMRARFMKVGQDVAEGRSPYLMLSAIIALAVWREGSEIVMFSYGMLAAGSSVIDLATGAAIGMIGGLCVGTLLYLGMIKMPMKQFFQITTGLLILLVAGMISQGFGFLVATGAFENLSNVVWDSSWLVSERNFFGETLKVLVGYTARPTTIQIIVYLSTIGLFIMTLKYLDHKSMISPLRTLVFALVSSLLFLPSAANATKKVYAPYVEKGELELESKTGYEIDDDNDVDGAWKQKLGAGYGVTDVWFTEVYGEWEKEGESGADTEFTAIEWENKFQLTNPGEYWADFGALVEYVHNTNSGPDKIEVKGLAAKDVGKFSHTVNAIVEREIGEDSSDETEFGTAFNSRYRYSPQFEPGIEMYNDFGDFEGDFDDHKHMIGPVAQGMITDSIGYDAGVLFGMSDAAPDATLKLILEYEMRF
ncbi:MAG: FTR1 family protein [Alphaproteobacteria bacterium]